MACKQCSAPTSPGYDECLKCSRANKGNEELTKILRNINTNLGFIRAAVCKDDKLMQKLKKALKEKPEPEA